MKALILRLADTVNAFPLFHRRTRYKATVFMLHHFCSAGEGAGGAVTTDLLDRCLRYLAENDYRVITLSEYVERLRERAAFYKTVVFSVDDGYRDFYEYAYPLFVKYRMPAAVFLVTDFIDRGTPLWWDQIAELVNHLDDDSLELKVGTVSLCYSLRTDADRRRAVAEIIAYCKEVPDERRREIVDRLREQSSGTAPQPRAATQPLSWGQIEEMGRQRIEFFPHTLTHPILAHCDSQKIIREIEESKRRVEEKTGSPARIFCYPNGRAGDFDARVVAQLKQAGYEAAVTAEAGHDDSRAAIDLFRLKRYAFPQTMAHFKQIVSGLESLKDAWRSR